MTLLPSRMTAAQKYERRWWTLGVLSLSLLIIGLDNTILNIAIPTLQVDLDASASALQWMVDSYVLVFAGLLLTMGTLGDRFGRGRALAAGLVVFGIGSIAAAFSGTAAGLIVARAGMGVGGALVMPATLSILTDVFPREERGRAIGIWAAVSGLGIGLGPVIGGLLLEYFWWGSVFLVNVPVVVIALGAGWFLVPASRDPEATPVDVPGAIMSMVSITTLVFGIIEGPARGWTDPLVVGSLVAAVASGLAFFSIERRSAHPMLNLDYFRNRRFSMGAAAISIAFFSLFGVIFLLTQYLQFVHGYTALEAGLRTAPVAVGVALGSAMAPRFAERFGTARVVAGGLVGLTVVLGVFATFGATTSYVVILLALVAMAFSMGNVMAPATDAVMGAVPVAKSGVASATNDVTRQVAGALGVAVLGSAFNSAYASNMADAVSALPAETAELASNSVGAAVQIAAQLPAGAGDALATAARQGFTDAMGIAVAIAAGVSLVGAYLVARLMPAQHLDEETDALQPVEVA